MPELPEVETTARGLRGLVVGKRVAHVANVDWPRMLPNASQDQLEQLLAGKRITAVRRRGKYLLLDFEDDVRLAIHRKMSGNVLVAPSAEGRPERHTHLVLEFDDGTELRFVDPRKFGRVYLFHSAAEEEAFLEERLGPEPLSELDAAVLAELLRGRRGRIKSLLLNQAFLAGVGNIYADEALWLARIHPERAANSLTRAETRHLADAIKQVLEDGIARRGTSFSQYRDAEGLLGENQEHLKAYGREGEPCDRCGRPLQRMLIGQRSAFYCARCQPATR